MTTLNVNHPLIAALHAAIMKEHNCCLCPILGPGQKEVKLIAVFVLRCFYSIAGKELAVFYALPFCMVPNAVIAGKRAYATEPLFRDKLHRILNYVETHGEENVDSGAGRFSA